MSGVYASYPLSGGSSGTPIIEYANFAAFPSAVAAGNGALALALDTGILYESNGTVWRAIGGPGTALSIGTIDSGTPSANGAHIDSNALIMQSASATVPGLVNDAAQTFAGPKTFNTAPILNSLTASLPLQLDASKNIVSAAIDLSGAEATGVLAAARFPALTGDVTTSASSLATSLVATSNATLTTLSALTTASSLASVGTITSGTWNATTIAIAHGGTGQVTANAAFDALSPMTTAGDIVYENATPTAARLGIGSAGQVLTVVSGLPAWAAPATSGTVTSVGMTVPTFLSVSPSTITSSGTFSVSLSGTALPVANGGTGQTTAAAAFNALNPMTTAGDIIYESGTGSSSRLAIGSSNQVLTVVSGLPVWAAATGGITSLTGAVTGSGSGAVATSLVATSNATLTTLSALTTASSLATVGTIGTGVWAGTTVAVAHGGTGVTGVAVPGTSAGIIPSNGLPGNITGSAVPAGTIGELIRSTWSGSSPISSGGIANVATMSLTQGIWQIFQCVNIQSSVAGDLTAVTTSISFSNGVQNSMNQFQHAAASFTEIAGTSVGYAVIGASPASPNVWLVATVTTSASTWIFNGSSVAGQFYAVRCG